MNAALIMMINEEKQNIKLLKAKLNKKEKAIITLNSKSKTVSEEKPLLNKVYTLMNQIKQKIMTMEKRFDLDENVAD